MGIITLGIGVDSVTGNVPFVKENDTSGQATVTLRHAVKGRSLPLAVFLKDCNFDVNYFCFCLSCPGRHIQKNVAKATIQEITTYDFHLGV